MKQLAKKDDDGNVPVSVANMNSIYSTYQHRKESIPANVPVSMEFTHVDANAAGLGTPNLYHIYMFPPNLPNLTLLNLLLTYSYVSSNLSYRC